MAQVGVDMSPPEISYEIVRTASGRNTGELKIVVTDKQSGVDPSKTFVENINPGAEAGVPIVQGGPIPKTQTEKKLVWLYQLLIPTFTPTEQNESSFSILSESQTSAENMPREFADFIAYNPASLKSTSKVSSPADFVIKKPTNPNSEHCRFSNKNGTKGLPSGQKFKSFADIDTRNRDVTLAFNLSGHNNFDQDNLFAYIQAGGQTFPTRPLDQGGQWTASQMEKEPGLYMSKMNDGFKNDAESGAVLSIHENRYLAQLLKEGINFKSRPDLSPANMYPFYHGLLKRSGGNYMLAIDLSKGSDALGGQDGKVRVNLDQVYPQGTISMRLEFTLKNGKWVNVTCVE